MSSVNYTNQILDAVETLTHKAIENAGYNKTIQATIVEKISKAGKYKVKYQDSDFIAYANNSDADYPAGTLVYVLIPNSDFEANKIIIDVVDKTQADFLTPITSEDNYIDVSGSLISDSPEIGLCSYRRKSGTEEFDDMYLLYDRDSGIDLVNLDSLQLTNNLFKADSFLCGAQFKTALSANQKMQGNYGLIVEIDFKNNINEDLTTKRYVLDINSIIGQPYNLSTYTRQYKVFGIDSNKFASVKKIFAFSDGFPNTASGRVHDIFLRNIEFKLMDEITEDGYIVYIDRDKPYFNTEDTSDSQIVLNATVRLKNKVITDELLTYYWFKENSMVSMSSNKYVTCGGIGWECLNDYVIDGDIKEYVSNPQLIFPFNQALTSETKLKCVVLRNGVIFAATEDSIHNYAADYELTIRSDSGVSFYYDAGKPNLTCLINNNEDETHYNYIWSWVDVNNEVHSLPETTTINTLYENAVTDYENLMTLIETGLVEQEDVQSQLDADLVYINSTVQRVKGNKIFNLDLTQIYNKAVFKCGVINNVTYTLIGTASLEITNKMEAEGNYLNDKANYVLDVANTANALANSIDGDLQEYKNTVVKKFESTDEGYQMQFTTITGLANSAQNAADTHATEQLKYIRFTNDGTIELGEVDSPFKAKLTKTKLSFYEDDAEVAYVSNKKLYIKSGDIYGGDFFIGNFGFRVNNNGSISFKKVK